MKHRPKTRVCRILPVLLALAAAQAAPQPAVKVWEGTVEMPAYEFSGRETQPALFSSSTIRGQYPLAPFVRPFRPGKPAPRSYQAVFVENEYLKLTYLPEFGGRFFSLYDKVRGREVFYRNDVIKPAGYNAKDSFPLFGIELTGPWDTHALSLNGEPFYSHKVVRREDGAVSVVVGSIDPMYHMKVNFSATLHPGIAAMEMNVFCYNRRDGRMPQMFWISGALQATEKTRFIYPMTRTIGHTTSEIADWPLYNGIDYSWDRNNKHMLGVFGIDIYDNFQGAYMFDRDYGVFRYADRRIVQGMKLWTFGYGPSASNLERAYTDGAGPYIEVQSGRHVWDGHYEWVGPHKVENWGEWWVPVAGIGGLTTLTRDVALNLEAQDGTVKVALSATRALPGAKVTVASRGGEIFSAVADLVPEKPFLRTATARGDLTGLTVRVADAAGAELLHYLRPDANPGRQEYTSFTRSLEKPQKTPDKMSAEELVLAAEFKFKELNNTAGNDLLEKALERDAGYSRAHLVAGIQHFNAGRHAKAAEELEKAIERDPYLDEAYYYLAVSQFALGQDQRAERNLYYIWPLSAWYGEREYHLGRLAYLRKDPAGAASHLERALVSNAWDLESRLLLALVRRGQGRKEDALKQLAEVERIDPTSRIAQAERFFLANGQAALAELRRLMGGQSQEAIDLSIFYRRYRRWDEAVEMLRLAERDNRDPWGTPPEFYYTLAWCLKQKGDPSAPQYLAKARAAAGRVDRFPYREESEAPLAAAVEADPRDAVARFLLGCLLYHRERPAEAIRQWEAAVEASPGDFGSRRALGMAYAEQGHPVEKAGAQLEEALKVQPGHIPTFNDLSNIYARAGRFDEQLALLTRGLERSPQDDNLAEGIISANVMRGRYDEAEKMVTAHTFAPRHRTYGLRDRYRFMRYGMGAAAFRKGDFAGALKLFESASKPPVSLGIDDFQFESNPRLNYYLGRALDALGRKDEAAASYTRAIQGVEQLSERDSFNSENFHMVAALERLGRKDEAARLAGRFEEVAKVDTESKYPQRRAGAYYLLGLLRRREGKAEEARRMFQEAVKVRPDYLAARLELRGEAL